jgi:hypothetical protein
MNTLLQVSCIPQSRNDSVGIAAGCGKDDPGVGIRVLVEAKPALESMQVPIERYQGGSFSRG